MGTQKFPIKTFESFSNAVVEFKKRIYDSKGNQLKISPGKANPFERGENSFSIDLHEIELEDSLMVELRRLTDSIQIELIPDWVSKAAFEEKLPKIINSGENSKDVLALAIRVVCPVLNLVLESKRVPIEDVNSGKPIKFKAISLNDVVEKVEIQSELVRVKNSNPTKSTIAFSTLTILAKNKTESIYIDEVKDIGDSALPIVPGDTKDKMFVMKNIHQFGVEPPRLIYHRQFESFFNNGDDLKTVQTLMILIGLPYCELLLKWIIYGNPNFEKKEHISIVKFIGELCDKKESELELIRKESNEAKKTEEYLKLSSLIFENIQGLGVGWKKMLLQLIKTEKS